MTSPFVLSLLDSQKFSFSRYFKYYYSKRISYGNEVISKDISVVKLVILIKSI